MKNINAPRTDSSVVRNLTLLLAVTGLVAGCRNRLLDKIDATVSGLEVNCASLLSSTSMNTIMLGANEIKITGRNGESCGCKTTESSEECSYQEPNKGHGPVSTERHFTVTVSKDGESVITDQRNLYKPSSAMMGIEKIGGVETCVSEPGKGTRVGITADACRASGLLVRDRVAKIRSGLERLVTQ